MGHSRCRCRPNKTIQQLCDLPRSTQTIPTMINSQSLPPEPPLGPKFPQYTRAYDIVLKAEHHAKERLAINPLGQEEMDNLIFARVTGFLLIEFADNRKTIGTGPCVTLALEITAAPFGGSPHDLVFDLGKR